MNSMAKTKPIKNWTCTYCKQTYLSRRQVENHQRTNCPKTMRNKS